MYTYVCTSSMSLPTASPGDELHFAFHHVTTVCVCVWDVGNIQLQRTLAAFESRFDLFTWTY